MRRGSYIVICPLDAPFACSLLHLTMESALSEGCDDESALAEGGIGLRVAVPAQGDQPVEVEARTTLDSFDDVVDVEAEVGRLLRLQ